MTSRTTPEIVAVDPCEKMKQLPNAINPIGFAADLTNLHQAIPLTIHRSFEMRRVIARSGSQLVITRRRWRETTGEENVSISAMGNMRGNYARFPGLSRKWIDQKPNCFQIWKMKSSIGVADREFCVL
jgi:hypothetical protein